MKKKTVWLAVINLSAFIGVVVVNALASTLPLNGMDTGAISDIYPNVFVPAGITFSIWALIYLLLGAFAIYGLLAAFREKIDSGFVDRIGIWFLVSCLANAGWIFAWHWLKPGLSLLIMLVILASLIVIYQRQAGGNRESFLHRLLTRVPFSIYLGWITVATVANVTAFLVDLGWNGFGISQNVWGMIAIGAATFISCLMILRRSDVAYSAVPVWAFVGILIKRSSLDDISLVFWAAVVGIALQVILYLVRKLPQKS